MSQHEHFIFRIKIQTYFIKFLHTNNFLHLAIDSERVRFIFSTKKTKSFTECARDRDPYEVKQDRL
jgi:hypothetical protein